MTKKLEDTSNLTLTSDKPIDKRHPQAPKEY